MPTTVSATPATRAQSPASPAAPQSMPDLGSVISLTVAAGLYARAVRVLSGRGYSVPRRQIAAFAGGWALIAIALVSPIDPLSEELLSAHMAQHLLIADLAAPLVLIGIRTPVLFFLLPRPALVALARRKGLRAGFRFVRRPLVAIPVFMVVLYGWHIVPMFEAALRNEVLHGIQHQSFVAISLLVWWAALEPKRRRLRGELWKAGHILGVRLVSMMLGMALIATRSPLYDGFYGDSAENYGLSALHDQQLAGGMMVSLDIVIMMWALAFFFWRAAQDHDLAEARARSRAPGGAAGA